MPTDTLCQGIPKSFYCLTPPPLLPSQLQVRFYGSTSICLSSPPAPDHHSHGDLSRRCHWTVPLSRLCSFPCLLIELTRALQSPRNQMRQIISHGPDEDVWPGKNEAQQFQLTRDLAACFMGLIMHQADHWQPTKPKWKFQSLPHFYLTLQFFFLQYNFHYMFENVGWI